MVKHKLLINTLLPFIFLCSPSIIDQNIDWQWLKMCSSYSEQSKSFNLCMIFATCILFLGITVIFLALYNTHNLILSGFAVLVTGLIIVLHTNGRCCKSELTDENRSSSPVTNHPVLNSSRSHQLRKNRSERMGTSENNAVVTSSCTNWNTYFC